VAGTPCEQPLYDLTPANVPPPKRKSLPRIAEGKSGDPQATQRPPPIVAQQPQAPPARNAALPVIGNGNPNDNSASSQPSKLHANVNANGSDKKSPLHGKHSDRRTGGGVSNEVTETSSNKRRSSSDKSSDYVQYPANHNQSGPPHNLTQLVHACTLPCLLFLF
jgi:hypothetical protein